ncbi:MAG: hypothetical protein NVV83_23095 [Afipia sp.]|nr:hypothetical protein [Afipia sp.]
MSASRRRLNATNKGKSRHTQSSKAKKAQFAISELNLHAEQRNRLVDAANETKILSQHDGANFSSRKHFSWRAFDIAINFLFA